MSKKHPQVPATANGGQQLITQTISSPYPLPQQLEAFERYAPGSSKDVIVTAQESIRHQQRMQEIAINAQVEKERSIRESDHHKNVTIRWVLILAITGGFVLAFFQRNAGAYAVLFTELAALVGAFLYSKPKE